MKKKLFIIFLIVIQAIIFAQPVYLGKRYMHTDEYASVCITEKTIEFDNTIENGKLFQKEMFDIFNGENTNYIILDCNVRDTYFLYIIKKTNSKKYLYSNWEMTFNKMIKKNDYNASKLVPFRLIKAESCIIEKDKNDNEIRFAPENGDLFYVGSNPWAVKSDNKKIIYLNTERWRQPNTNYKSINEIVILNGFISPEKEYLYEQNSRAKRVRISYDSTIVESELKDIGNFQVISLPVPIDSKAQNNIKFEILDYYPGSKYTDVVISGMYYMDAILN